MVTTIINHYIKLFFFLALTAACSMPVMASVKYNFVISEQPPDNFFKPLFAEMVLSDDAVAAGQARNGQIESLVFGGGSTMQETNRITFAYLHSSFYDLTVDLSADRKTVTAITAKLRPGGAAIDNWVFHYSHPPHPTLDIHEFVGYIRSNSVALETTILPVPPTHHSSTFAGQWQRAPSCLLCRYVCLPIRIVPYCWFDWIVIVGVILVPVMLLRRRRNRNINK